MRLLLVDFNRDVFAHGVRHLSAFLREKGIEVSVAFLPGTDDPMFGDVSVNQLESLLWLAKKHDVIGLSLLSHHTLPRAKQTASFLKQNLNIPIFWGGVPIICEPRQFLKFSDYVCQGEGELFFLQLFNKLDKGDSFKEIKNLGYKDKNGAIKMNELAKFVDMSNYPPCSFDTANFYLIRDTAISFADDPSILKNDCTNRGYTLFTVRGCPFSCAYCCNNALKHNLRQCGLPIRKHPVESVIMELEQAKKTIGTIDNVKFDDDDFFVRTDHELEEFAIKYKSRVDMPFWINASMWSITRNKLDIIDKYKLGLHGIKLGLQSGSETTNKQLYGRNFKKKEFLEKLKMLHDMNISVIMDTISSNPFEDVGEKRKTALFLADCLDKIRAEDNYNKCNITVLNHKLMFYPGTDLFNKALASGLIREDHVEEVLCKSSSHTQKDDPYSTIDVDWLITKLFNHSQLPIPASMLLRILGNNIVYQLASTGFSKALLKAPIRAARLIKFGG